jgi:diamine N-acetyltransferase
MQKNRAERVRFFYIKNKEGVVEFRKIDLERDFELCLQYRQDSYFCSFQSLEGFAESVGENGLDYRHKMLARSNDPRWGYFHVYMQERIVGQIEFKTYSHLEQIGYVHLFYLEPSLRGKGLFKQLHQFVVQQMTVCTGAVLAVARENHVALQAYQKQGWIRQEAKNEQLDYLICCFSSEKKS